MTYIRSLLLSLVVIACVSVSAQSVSRSVLSSAGTTQTKNGERVTWTVGEPVVGTMTGGNHQLGNGFFPSMDISVFLTEPEKEKLTDIEVYPNPSSSFIKILNKESHNMQFKLATVNGNILREGSVCSGDLIDLAGISKGTYLLEVSSVVNHERTSFKLVIK